VARVNQMQASDDIWHLRHRGPIAPPREPGELPVRPLRHQPADITATIGSPPKGCCPSIESSIPIMRSQRVGRSFSSPRYHRSSGSRHAPRDGREHIRVRSRNGQRRRQGRIARAGCPAEPAKTRGGCGREGTCRSSTEKVAPPAARQAAQSQQSIVYWTSMSCCTRRRKAAIARAGCPRERQRRRGRLRTRGACRSSAEESHPPAARQAAQKPAKHCRWDIDELRGASRSAPARPRADAADFHSVQK